MSRWHDVLLALSKLSPEISPKWYMNTTAGFYFSIPREGLISADRFAEQVEFPFVFSEIDRLVFHGNYFDFSCDLRLIQNTLEGVEGITMSLDGEDLIVTLDSNFHTTTN